MILHHLGEAAKATLRRKIVYLNAYIRKEENLKIM